jgi:DinB superfamily
MAQTRIRDLLALLEEAYAGPAWHGPSLRGSLRGVTHREAGWRPAPSRHNIWELVVHAAYWKYAVRRRLLGEKRGGFAGQGSNWLERRPGTDPKSAKAWRRDLALLARTHGELCEAVSQLTDAELERPSRGSSQKPGRMIAGIALHDVYHAGQIQLLKRLARKS